MRIITSLEEIEAPFLKAVVTVGNFDGVHLGHQALMQKVKERARAIDGTSVVFTFEPHPVKVLKGKHLPLITPFPRKMELIAQQGIEIAVCPPFTKEFAQIGAKEFICEILMKKIGMKEMVVGYDFAFGKKREGNIDSLKTWGEKLGFKVHVVGPICINGVIVSSTKVREFIMAGEMERVKELLGRYYQVTGKVIRGKNRGGRLLGIPTANLKLINEVFPKNGVYAVEVIYEDKTYHGVANIGFNPTFGDNALSVETHILDFNQNIYGETIRVIFVKRLRDEKKFDNLEALKAQIQKDIEVARKILTPNLQSLQSPYNL
jgi:riboflavin kinase/FMN adenylyltransferase